MFEGYLQSIDTHILYSCMHSVAIVGPTCNQRSISTLENETFFGVLEEIGATKHGYPIYEKMPWSITVSKSF